MGMMRKRKRMTLIMSIQPNYALRVVESPWIWGCSFKKLRHCEILRYSIRVRQLMKNAKSDYELVVLL